MHFRKRVMRQSYLQKHFQYRNEAQSHTKQHTSNQCNVFNWMMILLTEANKFLSYLQIWNIILFALEMNGLLIGCSWPAHELLIIFARHLIYRGQKSMKQLSSSALYSKSLFSFSIRKLIWFPYLIPIQRKHNGQIRIHLSINWTRVNNILIWLLFLYAVIFVYIASILPAFYILIYTLFVVAQKSHSNVPPMDMSFSPHAKLSCASVNKLRERQKKKHQSDKTNEQYFTNASSEMDILPWAFFVQLNLSIPVKLKFSANDVRLHCLKNACAWSSSTLGRSSEYLWKPHKKEKIPQNIFASIILVRFCFLLKTFKFYRSMQISAKLWKWSDSFRSL